MRHFSDDDVMTWILGEELLPPHVEEHARECRQCAAVLRKGEQFVEVIRDPAVWEEPPSQPESTAFIEQLEQLEDRLQTEREDAEAVIRYSQTAEIERQIAIQGGTVGMVRALIDRSFEEVERNPEQGERFANLAVLAASLLRPAEYGDQLVNASRGQAWKQRANAFRMCGKFAEALRDLEDAEAAFLRTTVPDPEIAAVNYICATIFWTQGRLTEARQLLEGSSAIFVRFGDDVRFRSAQLLLSGVLDRQGEHDVAIELLRELLKIIPSGDTVFRGRALIHLGVFLMQADDPRAESYLQQAHHCLGTAGLRTEALRALWNLGRAALRQGHMQAAAHTLEEAYEEAAALGLQVDVAMIALDRAELYLAQENLSLVESLCRDALETFQAVNAPRFAADAFAYLETAAKRQQLSASDLAFVREFFNAAGEDPERRFVPPGI